MPGLCGEISCGSVIITSVAPGSQAEGKGLQAGAVVAEIDGVNALKAVTRQGAAGWLWVDQCCSNPATSENQLLEQYRTIVRAPVGTQRALTVELPDGTRLTHVVLLAEADDYRTWELTAPSSPWSAQGVPFDSGENSPILFRELLVLV